uniref:Uncharacterized protein n=1 Tax=Quercus lobata TaxID=97700 RepID=A0A7N2REX6_QUELO
MVMCSEWFSRIYGKVGKWYHDYIFFSKAVPFIFGLIVSHSMINLAVVGMFIDYLTSTWEMELPRLPSWRTICQQIHQLGSFHNTFNFELTYQ